MIGTQLTQMALSAIMRTQEQLDLFSLNDVLCGRETKSIKQKGIDQIKAFGVGKAFSRRQWYYFLIQMLQQEVFVIDYTDSCFLKVTDKGQQVLKGLVEIKLIAPKIAGLRFTRQGKSVNIDWEIQDAIDWRELTDKIGHIAYWNYKSEQRININTLIPLTTPQRNLVVAKFIEILQQIYNLSMDGDCIIIPKKVDLDMYGNEVKPLQLPFEECLTRFKQFVVATNRYPKMNALSEEVALRKWFREVGHGLIYTTPEQMAQFRKLTAEFPMDKYK